MKNTLVALLLFSSVLYAKDPEISNPGFEEPGASGENIPSWQVFTHLRPTGSISVDTDLSKTGTASLKIVNQTGVQEFTYLGVRQLVRGLEPGRKYRLTFEGKGEISGEGNRFGVSSDEIGNEKNAYAEVRSSDDWVEYSVDFTADESGQKYIIFMTADFVEDFHIDNVQIKED